MSSITIAELRKRIERLEDEIKKERDGGGEGNE
jgi:hypothetical protein